MKRDILYLCIISFTQLFNLYNFSPNSVLENLNFEYKKLCLTKFSSLIQQSISYLIDNICHI